MENIPVPPYPGPPQEATSCAQQSASTHQAAPQTHHIIVEARPYNHQQSPGPQHPRSLPIENIPAPPYPGPPLESQSTSSVQQRTFTHQQAPQTHHTSAENGSCNNQQFYGPQHHRPLTLENIPAPPYPGPPLESQSTSSVQQRTFTYQQAPQTHHIPSEGGTRPQLHFPGPQRQSSLSMENIPVPQYPGPPRFDSIGPLEQRAQTHQPSPHTQHITAEGSPYTHLPSPHPQHVDLSGTSGTHRPVHNGEFTHRHHGTAEGIPCQHSHSHCNHTFYPQDAKHSPACMEKDSADPSYYEASLKFHSQGYMQENVFAQQDAPLRQCAPAQGAKMSVDATCMRTAEMPSENAFCMDKMSASLTRNVPLEQTHFAQSYCSSEKSTIEISKQTTTHIKLSTESVSTGSYSSSAANLQLPKQPVQQIIPDTSASMYTLYGTTGAVQPGVQVVHTGRTQVVIQPQRQAVVLPSVVPQTIIQPQQAVVIQPAGAAVRVIQPQVLPTVLQPASNTVVYRRYY